MKLEKREEIIIILEEVFVDISKSKLMVNRYLETGNYDLLWRVNDLIYGIYDKYKKENTLIDNGIIDELSTLCYLLSNIFIGECEEMNNLDEKFKCRYYLASVEKVSKMILDEICLLNTK